ncbi:hypothetical protein HDU97_003755 [Phlyctochytrium planicorne]|nr:hypothetical protein HDU97_003755 [Phlyctochytrium planicorne]
MHASIVSLTLISLLPTLAFSQVFQSYEEWLKLHPQAAASAAGTTTTSVAATTTTAPVAPTTTTVAAVVATTAPAKVDDKKDYEQDDKKPVVTEAPKIDTPAPAPKKDGYDDAAPVPVVSTKAADAGYDLPVTSKAAGVSATAGNYVINGAERFGVDVVVGVVAIGMGQYAVMG